MPAKFVSTDPEALLAEIIADFEASTGQTLQPGQPEYLWCSAFAYRIILERQRMNAVGNSQLIDFSTAPILDYIVALFGVTRLPAQSAQCTLRFTLVEGHGNIVIPQNTRVISIDGQVIFATKRDMSIDSSTQLINIDSECQVSGANGNGYEPGTINQLQDVQAYISAVENIDTTAGGSDVETDEQLRSRAKLASSGFSVAGSKRAYRYFALSVSPLIIDVGIMTYSEDHSIPYGQVNIYPLLTGGQLANDALLSDIAVALSPEDVRPCTDKVVVVNPTKVEYSVTVNVTKYPSAKNSDITSLLDPLLLDFGNKKMTTLGQDIINSEIEALCRVVGIYDLEVLITTEDKELTGDNLVISPNEFPLLTNFTVNIVGSNNG